MNPFRAGWLGSWVLCEAESLIDATLTDKRQIGACFMLGSPKVPGH